MFTLTGPNYIDANAAVHRLTETRKRDLVELRRRLSDALSAAHTFRDPDLTDEANNRRRADMARAAREQAAADLDRIERETDNTATLVRAVADKATATPGTSAAEQLLAETRQARAWDRARALLDAGRTVPDVTATADADTLYALRTELPAYLAARYTKPQGLAGADFTEPDPARIVHTVERALADRLPAEQGAALRARLNLDALEPGLRETLAGLRREVDGTADPTNALRSAVAARIADQQAAPPPAA